MFQAQQVQDTRIFFFETWKKHKQTQTLTPLESQVVAIMLAHPEYHTLLDSPDNLAQFAQFGAQGETNPFLHMGLHLAIQEQVSTDRPTGITAIFEQLLARGNSPLDAEHKLMQCLEVFLWHAQQNGSMPDERQYLATCQTLI